VVVRYVKPHGALYNQVCRDERLSAALLDVVGPLPVMGLPGSKLQAVAGLRNHPFIPEGFADRRHREDGSLVPRTDLNAFVRDLDEAIEQVDTLLTIHQVKSINVHGDNPQAVDFARRLRDWLEQAGHDVTPFVPA
jgi:UPF0271 protein